MFYPMIFPLNKIFENTQNFKHKKKVYYVYYVKNK